MTEQYEKIYKDIIQKRILNDEFDVETFKKREEKTIKDLIEKEGNFSHFIYLNNTGMQQKVLSIIIKKILDDFMDIFYDEECFPIIKDFKNNLKNYDMNLYYQEELKTQEDFREQIHFYDAEDLNIIFNIEDKEERELREKPFARIYIDKSNKVFFKEPTKKYVELNDSSLIINNIREIYIENSKLIQNKDYVDILNCFFKYSFCKCNNIVKENAPELRRELENLYDKLLFFLCDSIKIIYFNNIFAEEDKKDLCYNINEQNVYLNKKIDDELTKINQYIFYAYDAERERKKFLKQNGDCIKKIDNINDAINEIKEIEKNTRSIRTELEKYEKFIKINNIIDYYFNIHAKERENNFKNFITKIFEKFDNVLKELEKRKDRCYVKSTYYHFITEVIDDELKKIKTMEGQLSISTFMGFFNEEEYEIKTINDYDYDDYRGNVYLDDFDNEEEYKKFLKEIDEEYEKDSYEAYVWNKNVLYYNKNISKNELDNEIDILVSEEEKLIKILLDKLIVIKKNEQNKDSIKEMMSYYNFKYKIENEFYEKVYNKLDLKYREFIKEKSIYKFNILKRQNDFCSPLYYYSDLFKI